MFGLNSFCRGIISTTAFFLAVSGTAFAADLNSTSILSTYNGNIVAGYFDFDLTLSDGALPTFPVYLTQSTSFFDATTTDLKKIIEVPMRDWENGVESETPQYNKVPVKKLVGQFVDGGFRVIDPGNAYYDKPLLLSNGESFIPRKYVIHPDLTYYKYFRTDLSQNHTPLIDEAVKMATSNQFGPAFDLFKVLVNGDLPSYTMIGTDRGNQMVEWNGLLDAWIQHGAIPTNARVDRIRAFSNPALSINDPTSASTLGRPEMGVGGKKIADLSYLIDYVLSRRIDRQNLQHPRPNVLIYAEDNPHYVMAARNLFAQKVKEVTDFDRNMGIARAPLKLIILNLAPKQYYADVPNAIRENPQALANNPMDLSKVMIFNSDYRYSAGGAPVTRLNPKDPLAVVLAEAYDVSVTFAKQILDGTLPCARLMGGEK